MRMRGTMNTINPNATRLGGSAEFDGGTIPVSSEQGDKGGFDQGLTVSTAPLSSLDSLDEVDPMVEAALTRTDELGGLMGQIFNPANYPTPAMPDFANIS